MSSSKSMDSVANSVPQGTCTSEHFTPKVERSADHQDHEQKCRPSGDQLFERKTMNGFNPRSLA